MPARPPGTSAASTTVTSWPRPARWQAALRPPRPAPTTTTRREGGAGARPGGAAARRPGGATSAVPVEGQLGELLQRRPGRAGEARDGPQRPVVLGLDQRLDRRQRPRRRHHAAAAVGGGLVEVGVAEGTGQEAATVVVGQAQGPQHQEGALALAEV